MANEELLEFEGVLTEVLPDGNYRVKLDNDHEVLAYMSGKMRKFRIRTGVGDKVVVEMSPYDLDRGRINFRHRDTNRTSMPRHTRATSDHSKKREAPATAQSSDGARPRGAASTSATATPIARSVRRPRAGSRPYAGDRVHHDHARSPCR